MDGIPRRFFIRAKKNEEAKGKNQEIGSDDREIEWDAGATEIDARQDGKGHAGDHHEPGGDEKRNRKILF